jgi:hypothetical protein
MRERFTYDIALHCPDHRPADPAAVAYLAEATPDERVDLREPISA